MVQSGDSGALVLDDSHQAVALMFGEVNDPGNPFDGSILACQITDVQSQLHIAIETATAPNQVRTATTVHTAPHRASSPAPSPTPAPARMAAAFSPPPVIVQVEKEINEIPRGAIYINLLRKHAQEIHHLVNHNRRVATVWHRCKGPKILQSCLRIVEDRSQSLPFEIEGMPLRTSLDRFFRILERYGSRMLATDIRAWGTPLGGLPGKTYVEIKQALREEGDVSPPVART